MQLLTPFTFEIPLLIEYAACCKWYFRSSNESYSFASTATTTSCSCWYAATTSVHITAKPCCKSSKPHCIFALSFHSLAKSNLSDWYFSTVFHVSVCLCCNFFVDAMSNYMRIGVWPGGNLPPQKNQNIASQCWRCRNFPIIEIYILIILKKSLIWIFLCPAG